MHVVALRQTEQRPSTDKFAQFWHLYPRHIAKAHAVKMWERLTQEEQEQALQALPQHVRYWRSKGTETDFIPHPGSWLNGRRFEDEIELNGHKGPPWWSSNEGIAAKAQELGIQARSGESWGDLKARINQRLEA